MQIFSDKVKMNYWEDGIGHILTSYSVTDESSTDILKQGLAANDYTDSQGNHESFCAEYDSDIFIQRHVNNTLTGDVERFKKAEGCNVTFEQDSHDAIGIRDIKKVRIPNCYVALKKLTRRDSEANLKTSCQNLNYQCDINFSCNPISLNEGNEDYESRMPKMWSIGDVYSNYLDYFDDHENDDDVVRQQEFVAIKQESCYSYNTLANINDGDGSKESEVDPYDNFINIDASSPEIEPKTQTSTTKNAIEIGGNEQYGAPSTISIEKEEIMPLQTSYSDSPNICHFVFINRSAENTNLPHNNGENINLPADILATPEVSDDGQVCNNTTANTKDLRDNFIEADNITNDLVSGKQFESFQKPREMNIFSINDLMEETLQGTFVEADKVTNNSHLKSGKQFRSFKKSREMNFFPRNERNDLINKSHLENIISSKEILQGTSVEADNVAKYSPLISGKQFRNFQKPSERNFFSIDDLINKSPLENTISRKEILQGTFVETDNVTKDSHVVSGKQFRSYQRPKERNIFSINGRNYLRNKPPRINTVSDKRIDSNTSDKFHHDSKSMESVSSDPNLTTLTSSKNFNDYDKVRKSDFPKTLRELLRTSTKKSSPQTNKFTKSNEGKTSKNNEANPSMSIFSKVDMKAKDKFISQKLKVQKKLSTEIDKPNNASKFNVPSTKMAYELSSVARVSCQEETVKSKVIELNKCIPSWGAKYPWMKFYKNSNVFSCKLCQESTKIFKLEKNEQIFQVSAKLRQHEETDHHRKVSVISRNIIIQKTIVDCIKAKTNSVIFTSSDLFYNSLINHIENVTSIKTERGELETLINDVVLKLQSLETLHIENVAKKGISFVVDECRQILIIRFLNYRGLPIELLSSKYLYDSSTFDEIAKKYQGNAVYCKYVQCGNCQSCLKNPKPYGENTLPIRYPTISSFVSFLENDPAIVRYTNFLKTIYSLCQYVAIHNVHWTNSDMFAHVKINFSDASKQFLYIEYLLQLIHFVGQTILSRQLIPSNLVGINILLVKLKGILTDESVNYITFFLREFNHKCYIDGIQNLKDFDCIFKLPLLMNIQNDYNLTKAFRSIFNMVKNHLAVDSPDVMMVYLSSFGHFIANQMPDFNFTLREILQKFISDEPFSQTFYHSHTFYKTIALLPCFGAYWETSLINATECVNSLVKNTGKPLALQILQIMNSDLSVVQKFFEEK